VASVAPSTSCAEGPGSEELQAAFDWDFDPTQTEGTACSFERPLFIDQSTGDPTSWHWQFPDGSTSEEQSPVVPHLERGDVTLTVSRGDEADSVTRFFVPVHC
jgi:hypothetical protein